MNILHNPDIKGAIFDVDGVLLDSMSIWNELGARYLSSLDKTPEEGLREILFSMSLEQGASYLREHYLPEKSDSDIMSDITKLIEDYYYYEVTSKDGVCELLSMLKSSDIRIVVATSSPRKHVENALVRNNLMPYIEKIYTTTEVGKSKHSPDIFFIASEYMGLNPSQTLVFEDSLYAAKTAADAGFLTVGVYDADGESDQDGLRDTTSYYVRSLKDAVCL